MAGGAYLHFEPFYVFVMDTPAPLSGRSARRRGSCG